MGRPIKTAKPGVDLGYPNLYGVVAGDTGTSGIQILATVKIAGEAEADGFIVRQKGSRKYLVQDAASNRGTCVLVDGTAGSLNDGEMIVEIEKLDGTTVNLAKFSNKYGYDFDDNGFYLSFGPANDVPEGGIYEVAQVTSAG